MLKEEERRRKENIDLYILTISVTCHLLFVTCHISHVLCQVSSVTCHKSPLHASCYNVSKNITYVDYLIQIFIFLREGKIALIQSTIFLDVQANRVNLANIGQKLAKCG